VPLLPAVMVIQGTLLVDTHVQLLEEAVTAALPVPLDSVNAFVTGAMLKLQDAAVKTAVIDEAAFTAAEQDPVPEHPDPLQPEKVEPLFAVAVEVTAVPAL
jgi:hypothetical protein